MFNQNCLLVFSQQRIFHDMCHPPCLPQIWFGSDLYLLAGLSPMQLVLLMKHSETVNSQKMCCQRCGNQKENPHPKASLNSKSLPPYLNLIITDCFQFDWGHRKLHHSTLYYLRGPCNFRSLRILGEGETFITCTMFTMTSKEDFSLWRNPHHLVKRNQPIRQLQASHTTPLHY